MKKLHKIFILFLNLLLLPFPSPIMAAPPAYGWILTAPAETTPTLYDLRLNATGTTGYAAGKNGAVRKLVSGSWVSKNPPGLGPTQILYSVDFVSSTVYVVGENALLKSPDNGETWSDTRPAGFTLDGVPTLYGVDSVTTNTAAAVGQHGDGGITFFTTNGGTSWTRAAPGSGLPISTPVLRDVSCLSTTTCYAVGDAGTILRTSDSGVTWTAQAVDTTSNLRTVFMRSTTLGWVAGEGGTLRKTTDGTTWTRPQSASTFSAGNVFTEIDFVDDSSGMLVGENGLVRATSSGGTAWGGRSLPTGSTTTDLYGVDLITSTSGWAVGEATFRYDFTYPTVGSVTPTTATSGIARTMSATYSDNLGVTSCAFFTSTADADTQTPITLGTTGGTSGTASVSVTFPSSGPYSTHVDCTDTAGNTTSGATTTVTVSSNMAPNPPTLSQRDSSSTEPAMAVGFTDDDGNVLIGASTTDPDGNTIRIEYEWRPLGITFSNVALFTGELFVSGESSFTGTGALTNGSYHWQARATDSLGAASAWVGFGGNDESAADFIISIPAATLPPAPGPEPAPAPTPTMSPLPTGIFAHDLIKIADDGNPNTFVDTAVYYVGTNGRRYVFPNDKAYFSWYSNFASVKTITSANLAAIPLGGTITYRPGVKMIKLQSSPTVYVVAAGRTLRAVPSEVIALALYGTNWNQQIDDINDAFWTNYIEGAPLAAATDFNPASVNATAGNISSDRGL